MKKLPILFLLIAVQSYSQSIKMEFPAFAGKTYDFIIFQGSNQETVQQDTIPANGKFTLKIPQRLAPYTGMCRWLITGTEQGGGLDMAIPGYDYSVTCLSDRPDNDNISYKGFDAVNELNRLNSAQQTIIDKFETMSKATQLYDQTYPLYATFANEKAEQAKAYEAFQEVLKQNPNYNARFLPIVTLTKGIPHRLTDNYQEKAQLFNEFLTQKVNFADLFASGHWQGIIQSWVQLQTNVINDKAQFAKDYQLISDRISNPVQYTDFIGKVTYYLTQYGKDDYIESIAKTVLASGKVLGYVGIMEVYLKQMVGMKAPDLEIITHIGKLEDHNHNTQKIATDALDAKYSLLVFYKSGCGPCEATMQGLQGNHKDLAAKGIRIITLSADTEENVFKNTAAAYPWKDKYCNFDGTAGSNFKNYAVIGTPTMFILDSKGIIIEKMASMEQLLEWSKGI